MPYYGLPSQLAFWKFTADTNAPRAYADQFPLTWLNLLIIGEVLEADCLHGGLGPLR